MSSHSGSLVSLLRLRNNTHHHSNITTITGRRMTRSSALFLLLSSSCLFSHEVQCLKHSFHTFADSRTLIGPVGVPFGFVTKGEYHLSVLDFELHVVPETKKTRASDNDASSTTSENEILKHVEPGFFLQRFPNEAAFHQHLERLRTNTSACAFEYFRDDVHEHGTALNEDDDNIGGFDEVGGIASAEHGILLSMKARKKWSISTPVALNSIQYTFQKPSEEGLYFLIYQVCGSSSDSSVAAAQQHRVRSTFELDFHFFNVDSRGKKSYLTAGEMKLPFMFFFFSMSYLLCTIVWIMNNCNIAKGGQGIFHDKTSNKHVNLRHANRRAVPPSLAPPTLYKIHHLMSILLFFKFLSVFFESIRYHTIRFLGHAEFWGFVYYFFTFIKGVFLFTVILLIGTGWSFLKPFLNDAEKKIICLVLTLQVVNNVALVILTNETMGEFGFSNWNATLHLVDVLCCCAVLIPIVWQVNSLEKSILGSGGGGSSSGNNKGSNDDLDDAVEQQDKHQQLESYEAEEEQQEEMIDVGGENGRVLAKLKLFRSFYLLVVAYIYTTRILVYLFATMLNYKYLWIRYFVIELVTLCFYVVVGLMFRPMVENPYLSLKKDDDNVNEDDTTEEEGIAMVQSRTP